MADLSNFVKELNSMISKPSDGSNPIVKPVVSGKKVKVLIVSSHVNQVTGHSKVVFNIIKQLAAHPWIQLVHFGTQKLMNAELGREYPKDVKVIDGTALEKDKPAGLAASKLPCIITTENPDVVFISNALAVICS